jgi:hypothetical protein
LKDIRDFIWRDVTMKAFVLGLDHRIQHKDDDGRLEALIRDFHTEERFDLIAEEWGASEEFAPVETVGKKFADSFGVRITWKNIEMPKSIQESLGIRHALRIRSHPAFDEWTGPIIEIPSTTYLKRADELRERYWVCEILKALPRESVLVICGLIHVETMADKLEYAGFQIKKRSLCEYAWYRNMYEPTCIEVEKHIVDDRY